MDILAIIMLVLLPGLFLLMAMASAFFITIPLFVLAFFVLRRLEKSNNDDSYKKIICYGTPTVLSLIMLCVTASTFQTGLEDEAGSFQFIALMMVPFLWLYLTLFFAGVMKRLNAKTVFSIFGITSLIYLVCYLAYSVLFS